MLDGSVCMLVFYVFTSCAATFSIGVVHKNLDHLGKVPRMSSTELRPRRAWCYLDFQKNPRSYCVAVEGFENRCFGQHNKLELVSRITLFLASSKFHIYVYLTRIICFRRFAAETAYLLVLSIFSLWRISNFLFPLVRRKKNHEVHDIPVHQSGS